MTIEKISIASSNKITPRVSFKSEEKSTNTASNQASGSSKGVITFLSVLAAIGAAGVAVYKHKGMKNAVKKAEADAKKKIDEAEEKAKKAAEETENKIKEAVEKVKNEYEKSAEHKAEVSEVKKEKSKIRLKTSDNKRTVKKLEGNISDTKLTKIDGNTVKTLKENENGLIVVPRSTKLSEFLAKKTKSVKTVSVKLKNKIKNALKKTIEDIVTEPEVTKTDEAHFNFGKIKGFFSKKYNGLKNFFTKKTVQKNGYKKFYDEGAAEGIEYLDNETLDINSKKVVSNMHNDFWLDLRHKAKEKEYAELFKDVSDARKISEKDLIAEYNELKIVVKNLPVDNPKALRFLEIQGELTNHRGYIFKDGELHKVKPFERFFGKKADKGLRELDIQETTNAYAKKVSDAKNANWLSEQKKIKEKEYEKLFNEYFMNNAEVKNIVKNLERKLNGKGKLVPEIPRKNNKKYHNKLQKEYDKLAILPEKPVRKTAQVKKNDVKSYTSFFDEQTEKGLHELEMQKITDSYAKKVSDAKNANWLSEQKNAAQEEYQKLFDEYYEQRGKKAFEQAEKQLDGKISVNVPEPMTAAEHDAIQKEYDKLGMQLNKFKQRIANKRKEKTAQTWKENTKSLVEEKEQELNGNITVNVPKVRTKAEHNAIQKEYDQIGRQLDRIDQKQTDESNERTAKTWKDNVKALVEEKEQELNGNITISVPKARTKKEHNAIQKEYDKLAILPQKPVQKTTAEQTAEEWKKNAKSIIEEKERELNGNITVYVPKARTASEHDAIQKEYELMHEKEKQDLLDKAKSFSGIPVKKEQAAVQRLSVEPLTTYKDTDCGQSVTRYVVNGLNELSSGFNNQERNMVKTVWRRTRLPKDDVTQYPKLYSTKKEERAAKKAYKKAKKAHIERRVKDYARHTGTSDTDTAIHNSYIIYPEYKFSHKKYKSMSKERPEPKDWEVEMTREEFMRNKEQYMTENFEKERSTMGRGQFIQYEEPKGFIARVKNFLGF